MLPFADDTCDAALSCLMLHHVGNWEAALRELVRVVKPEGRVIGCDVVRHRVIEWAEHTFGTGDERLISPDDFAREVAALGLGDWRCRRGALFTFRFELAV